MEYPFLVINLWLDGRVESRVWDDPGSLTSYAEAAAHGMMEDATEEEAAALVADSRAILAELWPIAEELAREDPGSPLLALYVDALNEVIDVENMRSTSGIHVRVPDTVMLLLFVGSVLTLGMVGLSAGLTGRRSLLTALAMIVVLGAVVTLIVDVDRPQGGTVTVSQEPVIELAEQIGPGVDPE